MTLVRGSDKKGAYFRWGAASAGTKKYHYTVGNKSSRDRARARALAQVRTSEAAHRTPKGQSRGKTGGARPKGSALSSSKRSRQKIANKERVRQAAAYRCSKNGAQKPVLKKNGKSARVIDAERHR